MMYLDMYCRSFNLKLEGDKIFDKDNNLVGKVEDEKYVHFTCQTNPIKVSDLWLATFERISVH